MSTRLKRQLRWHWERRPGNFELLATVHRGTLSPPTLCSPPEVNPLLFHGSPARHSGSGIRRSAPPESRLQGGHPSLDAWHAGETPSRCVASLL
jgi:hypothetical protein